MTAPRYVPVPVMHLTAEQVGQRLADAKVRTGKMPDFDKIGAPIEWPSSETKRPDESEPTLLSRRAGKAFKP